MNKTYTPFSNFERLEPETAKEIYKRLPRQMLVTNNLNLGLHLEEKTLGVRKRYIQINHQNLTKMMVFDVDQPISLYNWKYLSDIPVPNLIIINPKNQHSHMVYLLDYDNFVCRSENARLKDILIYQTIYNTLCERLNADSRYVQKIMKNPFHNSWNTKVIHNDTYTFEDFEKYVDLDSIKKYEAKKNRSDESFMREQEGRNCTVFERARFYAYSILKSYNYGHSSKDSQRFFDAVCAYAENVNQEFEQPLGQREIFATVKSIVNWTLLHFSRVSGDFEKKDIWGDVSRKKSIKTRSAAKQKNIETAGKLKAEGKSIKEICQELKRSERMVEYYLEEYKRYIKSHPEAKEELKEIAVTLLWFLNLQFVISDIKGIGRCFSLMMVLCLLWDSS